MKKFIAIILLIVALSLAGCGDDAAINPVSVDPFGNGGSQRSSIVVISDLHLGADLSYAECKDNLPALERFIEQVRVSPYVKELVIAGDLIDEWYVPAPIDTYQGKTQTNFVQRVAITNKGVFDALNAVIKEGKILVTYVPGNHDLTITPQNIESVLPGIHQARDEGLGLGTYVPADYPTIAIEHGHRYNFFCAPDPYSNQDAAKGTILPPGYFFTRIAALHELQGNPPAGDTIKPVIANVDADESQHSLFVYFKIWEGTVNTLTIENKFDEKIIVTNINGFTDTVSINDLVPYQLNPGGIIDVKFYKGIQDSWLQRQAYNHVAVNIPTRQAIAGSASSTESDNQARNQYFLNPDSSKRIVVFGHTHAPILETSNNVSGQKCVYVNSGTWIDNSASTRNFVVITPQNAEPTSQTVVKLYNYENDVLTKMDEDSIRL